MKDGIFRTMRHKSQAIVFWKFNGDRFRSTVGFLFAYLFVAYLITGIERNSFHHAATDIQAWCVDEGVPHTPDPDPLSNHQHGAMCCLSTAGVHALAIFAVLPHLLDPRVAYLSQRQILNLGQPSGFPTSAYGQSRAPPSLG